MSGPSTWTEPSGPARILVVEDDPVMRFNIRSWLEDSGYGVDEAGDGAAAMDLVERNEPDLVLCDLRMPGVDGLALLRRLRAHSPELPAVAVSGTGVLNDAVQALREGAWDFVIKPIQDMAVLEHAIEGALERARLMHQNRRYQRELEQANRRLSEQLHQIEQDADAGRRIQLQLMPPAAEQGFGDYRFSRYLIPSQYLSGDFVDYFAVDPQRVAFFLADVSGHGVSSAFVTVMIKSFMQRCLERRNREGEGAVLQPLQMLKLLNESMLAQRLDKYLTIFYGVIDCRAGHLIYANAGHYPSPLLIDRGRSTFLPGRGMPIGLFLEPQIELAELDIPPGSSLTLCSDGVLEALGGTSLDERIGRLLDRLDGSPTSAAALAERLGLDAGQGYPDDIAFLVLRREGRR